MKIYGKKFPKVLITFNRDYNLSTDLWSTNIDDIDNSRIVKSWFENEFGSLE